MAEISFSGVFCLGGDLFWGEIDSVLRVGVFSFSGDLFLGGVGLVRIIGPCWKFIEGLVFFCGDLVRGGFFGVISFVLATDLGLGDNAFFVIIIEEGPGLVKFGLPRAGNTTLCSIRIRLRGVTLGNVGAEAGLVFWWGLMHRIMDLPPTFSYCLPLSILRSFRRQPDIRRRRCRNRRWS